MKSKFKMPWHYYVFPMWLSSYIMMVEKMGIKATLLSISASISITWLRLKLKYNKCFRNKCLALFGGSPEDFNIYCKLLSGDWDVAIEDMLSLIPKEKRSKVSIQTTESILNNFLKRRDNINKEIKEYRKKLNKLKGEQNG